MLPFTRAQFIQVFADYNLDVWPLQILAYLIGIGMVLLLLRPSLSRDRLIGAGLAAMWIWTGIAYYGFYFSVINPVSIIFGALFVLQGVLIFHEAVLRGRLRFGASGELSAWLGGAFVFYAAILYPVIGLWSGQSYADMPVFGITPCPVTIFTLGMLLLTRDAMSRSLLVIPVVWSLVGGSAAFLLDMPQDWPLLASGLAILLIRTRIAHRLFSSEHFFWRSI